MSAFACSMDNRGGNGICFADFKGRTEQLPCKGVPKSACSKGKKAGDECDT